MHEEVLTVRDWASNTLQRADRGNHTVDIRRRSATESAFIRGRAVNAARDAPSTTIERNKSRKAGHSSNFPENWDSCILGNTLRGEAASVRSGFASSSSVGLDRQCLLNESDGQLSRSGLPKDTH